MNRAIRRLNVFFCNCIWACSCVFSALAFLFSSFRVRSAQLKTLNGILRENADTEFAKQFGIKKEMSIEEFKSLPETSYENYEARIHEIKKGKRSILTSQNVRLLEPTSGSSAATKLIPYTKSLKRQFQKAIDAWIANLFLKRPALFLGRHYWAVSPSTEHKSESSVRIGFDNDAEYLSSFQSRIADTLFAVPPEVGRIKDHHAFFYVTLLFIVKEQNLRLISVWHPSFLTILLEKLPDLIESLATDIEQGEISVTLKIDHAVRKHLNAQLSPDKKRAQQLRDIFCKSSVSAIKRAVFSRVWPNMAVISCWTEGNSSDAVNEVRKLFPECTIQPKGLIATEGIISFPFGLRSRLVAAANSHYLEFKDLSTGHVYNLWELQNNKCYSVLLTTSGGLYRYRLYDIVRITGFFNACPCLSFITKENIVSDLVGEKINLYHVKDVFEDLRSRFGQQLRFLMLSPYRTKDSNAYVLYLQLNNGNEIDLFKIRDACESMLKTNYHYLHARNQLQLQPLKIFKIASDAMAGYYNQLSKQGQKLGDIKMIELRKETNWHTVFRGDFLN